MPPGGLVQREAELTVLRQALTAARGGAGGVVVVHGTGGSGKSRLLEAAGEMARDADMRVLIAQGRAVERGFPFGVAIQLFEPHWPETQDATTPAGLLDRRALWADRLLSNRTDGIRPLPGDDWFNVIRDLLWLAGHLAAASGGDGPEPGLALLVDDLQRADGPSLRFLAYLATRIADRPMALIVAARTGVPATDPGAAEAIRDAADHVLTPAALSAGGVAAVVRAALPDAGAAFGHACNVVSGGNPFLLSELLQELRRSATSGTMAGAHELAEISPEAVARSVRSLLAELPAEASAVAAAVAVLGDGAPVSRTASVAQLDVASASRGADALAAASVLAPGAPLSFAQPMVATAVRHSLSMLERAELHRRAATALRQDRAPAEHVAAHLLAAEPLGTDPPVHPASAPPAAAQPTGAQPAGVVSRDHLARARLALDRGRALNEAGRHREAGEVLAPATEQLDSLDPELAGELAAAAVTAATFVPELAARARVYGAAARRGVSASPTGAQRVTLAHLAIQAGRRGEHRRSVAELVDAAWGDGALLEAEAGAAAPLLGGALVSVDELERTLEICGAVAVAAPERGAAVWTPRLWSLYHQGRISDALADAHAVVGTRPSHRPPGLEPGIRGALAACQVQLGRLDDAEAELASLWGAGAVTEIDLPMLLEIRAQLRLAQLRPVDALQDALEAGRRSRSAEGPAPPGVLPWRSTAALAQLALGQASRGHRLAQEELELARTGDVRRATIRGLRVLALAEKPKRRLDLLAEAVTLGESYPMRLEYLHALVDFGGALRRANQRSAARTPLSRALELCRQLGAGALAEQARHEIAATSAGPRRTVPVGTDELTPSEHRVAQLAARGRTTKQMAAMLFVTPKTVEFHLRNVYRKLDVPSSRAELTKALGAEPTGEPVRE